MTDFEIATLVISAVSSVLILAGLMYAGKQISLLKRVHEENHDWNRRIETQKALSEYDRSRNVSDLYKALGHVDVKHPIPLEKMLSEFRNNSDLEIQCHVLLNTYEGFAIGVHQGIYDEDILRAARGNTIIGLNTAYKEYIAYRQRDNDRSIYNELQTLASNWQASEEKVLLRSQLGTLK